MEAKKFIINYYKNSDSGIHIQKIKDSVEAQKSHSHEYFQIYYVVKGSLEHYTKDDFSTLSQGDMFIIPPNSVHYINHLDGAVFYAFSFMPESLGKVDSVNKLTLNFLNSLSKNNLVKAKITIPISEALTVNEIMEKLGEKYGVDMPITNAVCSILNDDKEPMEVFLSLFSRSTRKEF